MRMFITILYSAVSRILKTRNLLQILTKSSRLLWPPTSSQRQLGGQLFSSHLVMMPLKRKWEIREGGCDDNDYFLYMSLQLFAMHKPRLQAPSDYISDVFDSLDPSPQHHSCSFRFKWLELIVPWGSSVIHWSGTVRIIIIQDWPQKIMESETSLIFQASTPKSKMKPYMILKSTEAIAA